MFRSSSFVVFVVLIACNGEDYADNHLYDDAGNLKPSPDGAINNKNNGAENNNGVSSTLKHLRSGDRLRMRLAKSPGGATFFAGWYDSTLKTNCSFATAADGKSRCLPEAPSADENYSERAYQDAQCTIKIVGVLIARPDCAQETYVRVPTYDNDSCGPRVTYEVVKATSVESEGAMQKYYQRSSNGECNEKTSYSGRTSFFFRVDSTVAPEDMVAVTESIE